MRSLPFRIPNDYPRGLLRVVYFRKAGVYVGSRDDGRGGARAISERKISVARRRKPLGIAREYVVGF